MAIIRHTSIAVLGTLVVLTAFLTPVVETGDANITINPSHKNATVFEQQQFRRFCRYDGSLSNLNMLQILHNGTVRENSSSPAVLDIPEAVISDNGFYECQALLNSGIITGRTRMGYLTVIDRSLLNCPPEQYVVGGGSIQLQCSFQDPNNMYGLVITSSFRGDTSMSQVENAALENEGNYTCRVDLLDRDATLTLPFFLHVFTQEIVVPPSSVTVFSGNTAEFTCQTRNEHYAFWRLNGMILNYYDDTLPPLMDVDTDQERVGNSVTSYKLTIIARTEYHGLVFQCVAGVRRGGPEVESENATLMVQGLLDRVSDVRVESGTGSILLSWSPPYSLNVTVMELDILYTLNISNMTDETPVPCSDCHNLTQPHYTFTTTNPSPCHKYNFTIISQNGAGEGGRSEPVEAFFIDVPFQVNGNQVEVERKLINNYQSIALKLPESSCPGSKPEEYIVYCMGRGSICGTYKTERLKDENSVLSFTAKNTELPPNCSYTAIIEAINKFGPTNSTEFVVGIESIEDIVHPTPSSEPDQPEQSGAKKQFSLVLVCVVILVLVVVTLCLSALFLLVVKRWQKKAISHQDPQTSPNEVYELCKPTKCRGNEVDQTTSVPAGIISPQDPETSPNELYELNKPMKCTDNKAYQTISAPETISPQYPGTSSNILYELHKPIKCQGNQAYETVSSQAQPSSVEVESIAQEVQVSPVYEEVLL